MKIQKIISDSEIGFIVPIEASDPIKADIGSYLVEQILNNCASGVDINGDDFAELSPKYKAKKESITGENKANMRLTGDMLDALTFEITDKGVKVVVKGEDQAAKADGHNNFSGKSKLPTKRQFLADKELPEDFISYIEEKKQEDILNLDDSDFIGMASQSALYSFLQTIYGDKPKEELKSLILSDADIFYKLNKAGLLQYL